MFLARLVICCLMVAVSPSGAKGATITVNTIQDPVVYEFDGGPRMQGGGPYTRTIGDNSFVFTSTNGVSVFDSDWRYWFAANGQWVQGAIAHAGLNSDGDQYMTFTFQTPVQAVGGFMKYAYSDGRNTFGDARLRIRDAEGNTLETFNLNVDAPIRTLGVNNDGGFRGFQRETAEIKSFDLIGAYIAVAELTISQPPAPEPTPVPLPSGGMLLLAGLLGLAGPQVGACVMRVRKRAGG